MTESELKELKNIEEFNSIGYQYTIMYMARIHSQAEFLFTKILALRGKVYSDYEASEIIEAFTIKTICDWEWYAEKIICECLKVDTSQLSQELELKLPKTISNDECIAYLNGLGYFDLRSVSNLKSISKKILTEKKNPFQKISAEAGNHIDDFYSLRNYVAHRSNKSKRTLVKTFSKYKQNEFIEVGEFLLSKTDKTKKNIRFQDFGGSFWLAAFNIMEFAYPKMYKWIVQEEKIYNEKCHLRFSYLMEISPNKAK
ncbi:hypothetical protein [Kaistella jeonii]|uniref:RiboL-PSP-HEPN domain-containing protein n=1 Tax=Kaistella jeonii TaxID=266749 RepID=A0A0C1CJF1_9FLAO|nr:hypothetical protein [Kaistella jeonii]KIA83951.1 hypothetical protein OA86_14935 [Kaistella jeonii]SFC43158.1 hypothetical protein SAMN05421876_1226 [Kaistella jeonii]VEI96531.1 Uncharacterised protein [Kaistella jeonii]